MTESTTIDIASTATRSVKRALTAVGATVTNARHTPGAVGYTTLTVAPKAPTPAERAAERVTENARAYVAENFADAPSDWIAIEIGRIARMLAYPVTDDLSVRKGQSPADVAHRRALIAAYADVLAARATLTEGA